MPANIWQPWQAETDAIRREDVRRQRRRAAKKNARPDVVKNLSAMRRQAPWVPPVVALPLATAGHGPESPVFQQVAKTVADNKAARGAPNPGELTDGSAAARAHKAGNGGERFRAEAEQSGWVTTAPVEQGPTNVVGQGIIDRAPITAAGAQKVAGYDWLAQHAQALNDPKKFNRQIDQAVKWLADPKHANAAMSDEAFAAGAKVPVRYIASQIRQASLAGVPVNAPQADPRSQDRTQRFLTDVGGEVLDKVTDYLPVIGSLKALAAGDFMTAGLRTIPGQAMASDVTQQIIAPAAGEVAHQLGVNAAPAVRNFALATQAPMDIVNASLRATAKDVAAGNFGNATQSLVSPGDILDQSPFVQMLNGKEAGSGYFPDPTSDAFKAAGKVARENGPGTLAGHAWTPGRALGTWISNDLVDLDERSYDIISGMVDASVTIALDPANIAFNELAKARRAGTTFTLDPTDEARAVYGARDAVTAAQKAENAALREVKRAERLAGSAPPPSGLGLESLAGVSETPMVDRLAVAQEAHASAVAGTAEAKVTHLDAHTAAMESAGAYKGFRATFAPKKVYSWLSGSEGQRVVDHAVGNGDFEESWLKWNRQGPVKMHVELAQAKSAPEVQDIIAKYVMAGDVREVPNVRNFRFGLMPSESRWAQQAPSEGFLYVADHDGRVVQADRFLRNAQVPAEARSEVLGDMAKVETYDDLYKASIKMADAIEEHLVQRYNIPRETAHTATRYFSDTAEEMRKYAIDPDTAAERARPFGSGPELPTEMLASGVPLPDFRHIRRLTKMIGGAPDRLRQIADYHDARAAKMVEVGRDPMARLERATADSARALLDDPGWMRAVAGDAKEQWLGTLAKTERLVANKLRRTQPEKLDKNGKVIAASERGVFPVAETALKGFGSVWRKAKLFRPAWGLRVIGEEQARLWAYGFTGAFNHPIQALALMAGGDPESKLGKLISKFGGKSAYGLTAEDVPFLGTDELSDAMNQSFGILLPDATHAGQATVRSAGSVVDAWTVLNPSHYGYDKAVAEEIVRMHRDPVVRFLGANSREDSVRWLTEGDGNAYWSRIAKSDRKAMVAPGTEARAFGEMTDLERRQVAEWYVDSVNARINALSQGDGVIRQAILDGTVDGTKIGRDPNKIEQEFTEFVTEHRANGWDAPQNIRARKALAYKDGGGGNILSQMFDTMMWQLMPRPSNYLSRSPLFRQAYWQRVEEAAPLMNPETKLEILRIAEKANIDKGAIGRIAATLASPEGLTIKELDHVAKAHALSTTRDILYDLSERGQVFDMLREVIPFGEAWKEVLTRWAKAVYENPGIVHRVSQGITSARGAGIITKDVNGVDVMVLPGAEWVTGQISKQVIGTEVPVPTSFALSGLNIASAGLPGVGPAVTMALPLVMAGMKPITGKDVDDPRMRDLIETIFPYGIDTHLTGWDVVSSLLPTWGAWLLRGLDPGDASSRSTLNYTLNHLASTGEYDLHGPDGVGEAERMVGDAKKLLPWYMAIRSVESATAPSAPMPQWAVRDKKNNLVEVQQIRKKYHEKGEEIGYDKAYDWLMENYGDKNFLVAQGFTQQNGVMPRTQKGWDFAYSRPWLQGEYGRVYGLVVPNADGSGKFDLAGYMNALERGGPGDPTPYSLEQRVQLANHRNGSWVLDKAYAKVGPNPTDEQQRLLDQLDEGLKVEWPGYKTLGYNAEETPARIRDLDRFSTDKRALKDPYMRDIALATAKYFEIRDEVLAEQDANGYTSRSLSTAQGAEDGRTRLAVQAGNIISVVPAFAPIWNQVLRREFPAGETLEVKPKKKKKAA